MNDTCEAIILKQQDYRENDALITLFSKQMGKCTFIAKGIRKITSKNASSCLPFSYVEMTYDHNSNASLQILHTAQIKASHRKIREDFKKKLLCCDCM